ncbi:MAG: hypothetical protein J6Q64_04695, partial [Clostridia bacterium]|nr:hypothetical protein [Clostridia bacterium]
MVKVQSNRRTENRNKDEIDEGEHIVLLNFQIGEKEHNTIGKTRNTNNGNDKNGKVIVYKQQVDCCNQNAAPNRCFDGLADAIELNKVGGEYHLPNDPKGKN